MATLHELEECITLDAKATIARSERQLQEELEQIRVETERLVNERREVLLLASRMRRDEMSARMKAQQELECSQASLAAKNKELDSVFDAARDCLERLRGTARNKLLEALWSRVQGRMDAQRVIVVKKDAAFFSRKRVAMTVADGIGGFIAIGRGGEVRIDCRFETLLQDVRERKLAEIASILFNDSNSSGSRRRMAISVSRSPSRSQSRLRSRSRTVSNTSTRSKVSAASRVSSRQRRAR